jgi:hypothetical protein
MTQLENKYLTCNVCSMNCTFNSMYLMEQFRFKSDFCKRHMEKYRMSMTTPPTEQEQFPAVTDCPPTLAGEIKNAKISKGAALRFNEGKVPMAYVPLDLLDGAARVMEKGAAKYKDSENYRKGYSDLRSPLSSLMRHLTELQRAIAEEDLDGRGGHLLDKESGEGHIHHLITSALLLLHSMRLKGYKT